MLVSRNGLAFIRLVPDEPKARRQGSLERSQARKRSLTARVPRNLETASASDDHLDIIAFLQFQDIDHGLGETNRKAVPPLGDLHRDFLMIYITIVYHRGNESNAVSFTSSCGPRLPPHYAV